VGATGIEPVTLPPGAGCPEPAELWFTEAAELLDPIAALPGLNLPLTPASLLDGVELLEVNQYPVVGHGCEPPVRCVVPSDALNNVIGRRTDVEPIGGRGVNDVCVWHTKKAFEKVEGFVGATGIEPVTLPPDAGCSEP